MRRLRDAWLVLTGRAYATRITMRGDVYLSGGVQMEPIPGLRIHRGGP